MTFQIRPLSDALGAEVLGGNFKEALTVNEIDELKSAFLTYHLLCLRSDPLSPKSFYQVASYFGTPFMETTRKNWVGDARNLSARKHLQDAGGQTQRPEVQPPIGLAYGSFI